ncbi:hypothetical protein SVIOM342S_01191 [Streptomyces violaceorubidus]
MTAREQTSASTTPPAARARPYLIGVRHHSPALAVAVPRLLDAVDAEVVCVELPADFQPWLPYLADPHTVAPVALSGAYEDGRLHFYPLADFSPELAAIRWARDRGAEVVCCDLPLAHPAWSCGPPDGTAADVDELWERTVEALAPGGAPEAVRRAALGFGRALREDTAAHGGIAAGDLAREAHMRRVLAEAGPRRVAAVVGAFHAPGLADPDERAESVDAKSVQAEAAGLPGPGSTVVTSLVPYAFALLDPRSGYPAGIRDPRWRQAVLDAGGDPGRVRDAAARFITELCREIRASGDTAGTGEAVETLRLACDLGTLRGLPAPGRGELLEAVTSVLGKGRSPDRELRLVLVGPGRGRLAPGTPRSGLGPWVEAELAALRLPGPADPDGRDVRLAPLRSDLDARREILLQRLRECGVGYAEPVEVSAAGEGSALTTRWQAAWTPSVAARLDLVGVRGVTAAQAADGTLRENHRRAAEAGRVTPARVTVRAGGRGSGQGEGRRGRTGTVGAAASRSPARAGPPEAATPPTTGAAARARLPQRPALGRGPPGALRRGHPGGSPRACRRRGTYGRRRPPRRGHRAALRGTAVHRAVAGQGDALAAAGRAAAARGAAGRGTHPGTRHPTAPHADGPDLAAAHPGAPAARSTCPGRRGRDLAHIRRREDGRAEVVPERPVFKTRTARRNDWRLILVVDVSASIEDSVVWSALTAAVLGGAPVLSTHFLAFSTQVADLTGLVTDPLSLLLEVKVGGGTHSAAGLAHARSLVKVPDRTLVVVVSDFEEGAAVEGLLAEAGALVSSGVRLLGCAALDGGGVPRYSVPVARRLAAAGMPVAALSPLSLARWVGEQVRGASR